MLITVLNNLILDVDYHILGFIFALIYTSITNLLFFVLEAGGGGGGMQLQSKIKVLSTNSFNIVNM